MKYGAFDRPAQQQLLQRALRQRMQVFAQSFPRENVRQPRRYPPRVPPVMRVGPGFPQVRHAPQQPGAFRQYLPMPRY